MSLNQQDQDATFGRVIREEGELQSQAALLASKLKTAGRNFSRLGDDLQNDPPIIDVNKDAAEAMLSELWNDLKTYSEAAAALAEKSNELADLKRQFQICADA